MKRSKRGTASLGKRKAKKLEKLNEELSQAANTTAALCPSCALKKSQMVMCYVCLNPLPLHKAVAIGHDMHRCPDCYTGSPSWMRNCQDSSYYAYYNRGENTYTTSASIKRAENFKAFIASRKEKIAKMRGTHSPFKAFPSPFKRHVGGQDGV